MTRFVKRDFSSKRVKDSFFVVNQNAGTVLTLNEVSFFIWENLNNPKDIGKLCELLVKEYDVSREEATEDIKGFLEMAEKTGIIEKVE